MPAALPGEVQGAGVSFDRGRQPRRVWGGEGWGRELPSRKVTSVIPRRPPSRDSLPRGRLGRPSDSPGGSRTSRKQSPEGCPWESPPRPLTVRFSVKPGETRQARRREKGSGHPQASVHRTHCSGEWLGGGTPDPEGNTSVLGAPQFKHCSSSPLPPHPPGTGFDQTGGSL